MTKLGKTKLKKTELEKILAELIASEGPLPLDRYMALCLGHPTQGYYMKRDPFGRGGDFVTAPEVSQMFGELLGVWLAAAWVMIGRPVAFNLVELGPGRGTLMADILHAAKVMPGFCQAARVHLVEMSPTLRHMQKEKLGHDVAWHDGLADVPAGPMLLVANEFFDAIPIRQFEKRQGVWFERCIGAQGMGLMPASLDPAFGGDGEVIEFSPQRTKLAGEIGQRLGAHAGAALVIDYGHLQTAPGDTLQAVKAHQHVSITHSPGDSDLTSHVDFEAFGKALVQGGSEVHRVLTQRAFLLAMGLEQRQALLAAKADENSRALLASAVARLAGKQEMGYLFKVMAATSPGLPAPYPFVVA